MSKRVCRVLLLALICSCPCQLSCAAATTQQLGQSAQLALPNAALLSKLNTAVSKQTALNLLLANSKTKTALLQAAGKLGYGESEVRGSYSTPLRTVTGALQVRNADEEAYRALNWHDGFTFKTTSIPTYGPHNYKLGYLRVYPCTISSVSRDYDYLWMPGSNVWRDAVALYVDLPMEPALYTLTIKISRSNGTCYPGWLNPRPGRTVSPLSCYFTNLTGPGATADARLSLTAIPDGTGFVGFISANPVRAFPSAPSGIRRITAKIRLDLAPAEALAEEPMYQLIFRSFNITRL